MPGTQAAKARDLKAAGLLQTCRLIHLAFPFLFWELSTPHPCTEMPTQLISRLTGAPGGLSPEKVVMWVNRLDGPAALDAHYTIRSSGVLMGEKSELT